MKRIKKDALEIFVFDTRAEMGSAAGTEAAKAIKEAIHVKGYANVLFAAAPSQSETLETLCALDIDWTKVNAFHMDEYIGLDAAHPAGFRNFLMRAIFDRFQFKSVNLLNGNAQDAEAEAVRYGRLLAENPLDVCLMGIGENGHIAFNDPPVADFQDPKLVKIVELEDRCRQQQVNDGCFQTIDIVPKYALTVTVPGIMSARKLVCTVPSSTKADAVKRVLTDDISTRCPAAIMRTHSDAKMYIDREAAAYIPLQT